MKYSSRRVREYCRSNAGPNLSPLEVSRYEFKLRPMSISVHFSPALENSLGTDKGQAESKMDTSSTHVATWLLNKRHMCMQQICFRGYICYYRFDL